MAALSKPINLMVRFEICARRMRQLGGPLCTAYPLLPLQSDLFEDSVTVIGLNVFVRRRSGPEPESLMHRFKKKINHPEIV